MRVCSSGGRCVADLLGECDAVPSEHFRTINVTLCELDEREVCKCKDGCRAMPRAGECPGFLERRARLLGATFEEERLSQRYEPGVSPFASSWLGLEYEPRPPLGVGDAAAEIRRADHCDNGAHRRDTVAEWAVVGSVLCDT